VRELFTDLVVVGLKITKLHSLPLAISPTLLSIPKILAGL